MKDNTIKVLLLDALKGTGFRTKEIHDELDEYYNLLDCDTIDIVSRKIGGIFYDIVVDDEGLFREDYVVSAVNPAGKPELVGNLVFARADERTGELQSLTDADIRKIKAHGKFLFQKAKSGMKPIIAVGLDEAYSSI